jgi:hypothetical protein
MSDQFASSGTCYGVFLREAQELEWVARPTHEQRGGGRVGGGEVNAQGLRGAPRGLTQPRVVHKLLRSVSRPLKQREGWAPPMTPPLPAPHQRVPHWRRCQRPQQPTPGLPRLPRPAPRHPRHQPRERAQSSWARVHPRRLGGHPEVQRWRGQQTQQTQQTQQRRQG